MSGFSPAFLRSTNNSFVDLARTVAPETLPAEDLEAAVLDRKASGHRTFRRLGDTAMAELREG